MGKFTKIVNDVRRAFESGRTKSVNFRAEQLENLLLLIKENIPALLKSLYTDLRKSKEESFMSEISIINKEITIALKNLNTWCQPEKLSSSSTTNDVLIYNDPYGVVLIIGAWNYPLLLNLVPLVSVIAAGNVVIMKPSELAGATAKLLAELVPKYLDKDCYQVILADGQNTSSLLEERFDYIFFTGSPKIGKIIHAAANKYLTPTILELGGKNPVIIDNSADIENAALSILKAKCLNAGQTCVAPDYLLCSKEVGQNFINHAKNIFRKWYGENTEGSPYLGRIINDSHFQRISKLIKMDKVVIGGQTNANTRFIQPTILDNVQPNDEVMQEEIFGPILPILYVSKVKDAVQYVNSNEKPLALYLFTKDKNTINFVLNNTSSGGVTVNDTLAHVLAENAPFGGVGNSGMGVYHGKHGFDSFVHKKTVFINSLSTKEKRIRFQSYGKSKL